MGASVNAVGIKSFIYSTPNPIRQQHNRYNEIPEFFQCLGYRSVRRIVKDFPAYTLDKFIRLPKWLTEPLRKWATPRSDRLIKSILCHDDVFIMLIKKKPLSPMEWFDRAVVKRLIASHITPFKANEFFWGKSKIGLTAFTWYEVLRDTHNAYKKTEDVLTARDMFIHQFIKWFVGMIVGTIGSDMGEYLHPKKRIITGFMSAVLCSAVFDYFWNKLEPSY